MADKEVVETALQPEILEPPTLKLTVPLTLVEAVIVTAEL